MIRQLEVLRATQMQIAERLETCDLKDYMFIVMELSSVTQAICTLRESIENHDD